MRNKILLLICWMIACAGATAQNNVVLAAEKTEFHGIMVEGSAAEIGSKLESAGFAHDKETGKFYGQDYGYDVELSLLKNANDSVISIVARQEEAVDADEAASRYNAILGFFNENEYSPDLGSEYSYIASGKELEDKAAESSIYDYRKYFYQCPSWYKPSDPNCDQATKERMLLFLKPLLSDEIYRIMEREGAENLPEDDKLMVGIASIGFLAKHVFCRPVCIEIACESGKFRISVTYGMP